MAMWTIDAPSIKPAGRTRLSPSRVLYNYDGPSLFIADLFFIQVLLLKFDELAHSSLFVAAPTTNERIAALTAGHLSVRGVIEADQYWIVELLNDLEIIRIWQVPATEWPEINLPDYDVPLRPEQPTAVNEWSQLSAFLSMSFRGERMRARQMPLSVFRGLVDSSHEAAKRILRPETLEGTRSATFDFTVSEPKFGSLTIALSPPVISKKAVERQGLKLNTIRSSVDDQRDAFFSDMHELVERADADKVTEQVARDAIDRLSQIQELLPRANRDLSAVQFATSRGAGAEAVTISAAAGARLYAAYRGLEGRVVRVSGTVAIINGRRNSFVLDSDGGKLITCYLAEDDYVALAKDPRYRYGARITVRGALTLRDRRDLLSAVEWARID